MVSPRPEASLDQNPPGRQASRISRTDRETAKKYEVGLRCCLLWSPYVVGQTIIFSSCSFFLSIFFFSSPNLSGRRLDVYHTSTHGVALVRI